MKIAAAVLLLLAACSAPMPSPTATPTPTIIPTPTPSPIPTLSPTQIPTPTPIPDVGLIVMAAGDIACDPADPNFSAGRGTATACRQGDTAKPVERG